MPPRLTSMSHHVSLIPMSRRTMLALAGAALAPWELLEATTTDFWNKKDPSKWSQDEIDQLTTKSPWAKQVTATYAPGANDGGYGNGSPNGNPNGGNYPSGGGYPGGGMPRIGIGGIGIGMPRGRGMGGGQGRNGQGNGRGNLSTYKGTVRWDSAQPILDALKTPLPAAFVNHYVISVIDFPLLSDRRRQDTDQDSGSGSGSSNPPQPDDQKMLDDLKQYTSLQPKDKDRAQPGIVQRQTASGNIFLFGFAKEFFDFGKNDHEVDFSTRLGRLLIRAKFDPRDMMYHKKLAV